jgi:hypothetical protein
MHCGEKVLPLFSGVIGVSCCGSSDGLYPNVRGVFLESLAPRSDSGMSQKIKNVIYPLGLGIIMGFKKVKKSTSAKNMHHCAGSKPGASWVFSIISGLTKCWSGVFLGSRIHVPTHCAGSKPGMVLNFPRFITIIRRIFW